jgi:hypothetical protein
LNQVGRCQNWISCLFQRREWKQSKDWVFELVLCQG